MSVISKAYNPLKEATVSHSNAFRESFYPTKGEIMDWRKKREESTSRIRAALALQKENPRE